MAPKTPDTSGLSSVRPFASYDPDSRSWRTWTGIGVSDSTVWSGTWPKTGCMSDGLSYQLQEWGPRISASGFSSRSLPTPRVTRGGSSTETTDLLSTPQSRDFKGRPADGFNQANLVRDIEDLMPTPRAGDGEKGGPNQRGSSGDLMLPSAVTHLLPTPIAAEGTKPSNTMGVARRAATGEVFLTNVIVSLEGLDPSESPLLPTPAVNDMGAAYTPDQWDAWTARMKAAHNNGNGHGNSLSIEAQRVAELLPTPTAASDGNTPETHLARKPGRTQVTNLEVMARGDLLPTTISTDAKASGASYPSTDTHQQGTTLTVASVRQPERWGKYAAAIARWETITRPAPEPTNITEGYLKMRAKRLARLDKRPVGRRGSLKVRRQLAARFSEWMMGVPLGWITDVPSITRNEALKAAGNGVVPQQAAEALCFLLDLPTGRQIADAHEPDDLLELLMADHA